VTSETRNYIKMEICFNKTIESACKIHWKFSFCFIN